MSKFELIIPRYVETDSYEVMNLNNVSLNLKIGKDVKSRYADTTHFVKWSIVNGFPRISFAYVKNTDQIGDANVIPGGKVGFNFHLVISFLNKIIAGLNQGDDMEIVINASNTEVIKKEVDGKIEVTRGENIIPEGILKFSIKDKKARIAFKDLKEKDENKAYTISIPLVMDTKFVKTNITDLEFAIGYFENVKNTLMVAHLKYLERKKHVTSK